MSGSGSGVRQWLRKASLVAATASGDGLELSDLRVTFTATSWTLSTPAQLVAKIYNLSDQTAKKLLNLKTTPVGQTVGVTASPDSAKVTLQAGYEGNFGIVFKGDLVQAKWGRESPTDTFVELVAADGFMGHVWGIANVSLSSGWTPTDVNDKLRQIYSNYGVQMDDLPQDVQNSQAPRGKVMYGMARDYRRDLARSNDMNTYTYQGQGKWLNWSAYQKGDIVKVNSETGMISMPMQTQFGATVRMLLNPSVGPGTLLQIHNKDIQRADFTTSPSQTRQNTILSQNLSGQAQQSQSQLGPDDQSDGIYKVIGVTHTGDTRGTEWYTDCPLISTSSTIGQSNVPKDYIWALQL